MCAGEPLFSLTAICHFLPLHPTPFQNAASCPSLVATAVPPSSSGTTQDFTLSLSNIQEVRQTATSAPFHFGGGGTWNLSSIHVVKLIGIKQTHMVYLLQAELNTDGCRCVVIWVNEWAKSVALWSPCCEIKRCEWGWRENEKWAAIFVLMLLTAQLSVLAVPLVSHRDWLAYVFVSTPYGEQCSVWGSGLISLAWILNLARPNTSFLAPI